MKNKSLRLILLAVAASLFFSACKKDGAKVSEPLLTRASYNGMIAYKFDYSDKNLLTKWEFFKIDPMDNVVQLYYAFEYNADDQMTEMSMFEMPGNVPVARLFFEYNAAGKASKYTYYDLQAPDPSAPFRTASFSYNAQNQLITSTLRDADDEFILRYNLTYYPNGFLKQRDEYEETITNQLRLKSRTIYSVPVTDEIKGWENLAVIPLQSDEITRRVKYATVQRYTYNNGVLTHHISETVAGKEYNSDGTLERHTSTTQYIVPVDTDEVNNWEYEYIVQ